MTPYIPPRYSPSGSLTAGVPATSYAAGHYAFRTSILYLGMEPTVTGGWDAFRLALNQQVNPSRVVGGAYVPFGSVSVSAPFDQNVGPTNGQALTAVTVSLVGLATGMPEAVILGNGLQIAGILQSVPAWWLTIDGSFHTPTAFSLDTLNQAIAAAVGTTVRLRHHERRDIVVPAPGASVLARTRMHDACAGARLLSNVTAAACTRVAYTAPWTGVALPTAPPAAVMTPYGTNPPPSATPGKTHGTPATHTQPSPTSYAPPPPPPDMTPWLAAGGVLLALAVAAYVLSED